MVFDSSDLSNRTPTSYRKHTIFWCVTWQIGWDKNNLSTRSKFIFLLQTNKLSFKNTNFSYFLSIKISHKKQRFVSPLTSRLKNHLYPQFPLKSITWKLRMIVQIRPNVNFPFPSTMSFGRMLTNLIWNNKRIIK